MFTWGLGYDGRLGQGSKDNLFTPHKVILSGDVVVQDVLAGPDCSAIISATNEVYCCGELHLTSAELCLDSVSLFEFVH